MLALSLSIVWIGTSEVSWAELLFINEKNKWYSLSERCGDSKSVFSQSTSLNHCLNKLIFNASSIIVHGNNWVLMLSALNMILEVFHTTILCPWLTYMSPLCVRKALDIDEQPTSLHTPPFSPTTSFRLTAVSCFREQVSRFRIWVRCFVEL